MKPRIVIVDDHSRARQEMREQLERDFEIIGEATNGLEAIEICLKLKPEIVLTDVAMPQKSGIDAIGEILQKVSPRPHAVVVSGISEEAIVLRAIEVGASDYLIKPVDYDRLRIVLMNLMASRSQPMLSVLQKR